MKNKNASVCLAAQKVVASYTSVHTAATSHVYGPTREWLEEFVMVLQYVHLQSGNPVKNVLSEFRDLHLDQSALKAALLAELVDGEVFVVNAQRAAEPCVQIGTRKCGVHMGLPSVSMRGIPGLIPADFVHDLAWEALNTPTVHHQLNLVFTGDRRLWEEIAHESVMFHK